MQEPEKKEPENEVHGLDDECDTTLPANHYGENISLEEVYKVLGLPNCCKTDERDFKWGRAVVYECDSMEDVHMATTSIKETFGPIVVVRSVGHSIHIWQQVRCIGCEKYCDIHSVMDDAYDQITLDYHLQGFCSETCYSETRSCTNKYDNHSYCSTCVNRSCNSQRLPHCRFCGKILTSSICSTRTTSNPYDNNCTCVWDHTFKKSLSSERCVYELDGPNGIVCGENIDEHPGLHNDYWCPCSFRPHCRLCGGDISQS